MERMINLDQIKALNGHIASLQAHVGMLEERLGPIRFPDSEEVQKEKAAIAKEMNEPVDPKFQYSPLGLELRGMAIQITDASKKLEFLLKSISL